MHRDLQPADGCAGLSDPWRSVDHWSRQAEAPPQQGCNGKAGNARYAACGRTGSGTAGHETTWHNVDTAPSARGRRCSQSCLLAADQVRFMVNQVYCAFISCRGNPAKRLRAMAAWCVGVFPTLGQPQRWARYLSTARGYRPLLQCGGGWSTQPCRFGRAFCAGMRGISGSMALHEAVRSFMIASKNGS